MLRRFASRAARIFAKPRAREWLIEPAPEAVAAWRILLGVRQKRRDS